MRFLRSLIFVLTVFTLPAMLAQSPPKAPSKPSEPSRSVQAPKAPDAAQENQPSLDHGIYARSTGNGMCGAIVSYNFSPGDSPQLESVTTCTPNDAVVPQRARQQKPLKSPTPQVLQTGLRY